MKIEEELRQKKFASKRQMARLNIMFTANWLVDQVEEVVKSFGITHQQYNVLRILKGKHPDCCTAGDIREVMIDKSPDLTRLIDRLVKKAYVTRRECVENRRKLDIAITDKGLVLLEKIGPTLNKQFIGQTKITNQEANELSRILDKIRG